MPSKDARETQLARYKQLIQLIETRFKEDIQIHEIEEATFYSYRNMNRIFQALHQETIGKYIKRIRLEKAAEYLKYSLRSVSDIAWEVGYGDIAAFSKAFKARFGHTPTDYRALHHPQQHPSSHSVLEVLPSSVEKLPFVLETLPSITFLFLEYRGPYEDLEAIGEIGKQMESYIAQQGLIDEETIALAEILDDNEITEDIHCRYRIGIVLSDSTSFVPGGLFQIKTIPSATYARFIHQGSHQASLETYQRIYAQWMIHMPYELADRAILEIFLNDESTTPEEALLTAIYIPVVTA